MRAGCRDARGAETVPLPTLRAAGQGRGNYAKAISSPCREEKRYRNQFLFSTVPESVSIVNLCQTVTLWRMVSQRCCQTLVMIGYLLRLKHRFARFRSLRIAVKSGPSLEKDQKVTSILLDSFPSLFVTLQSSTAQTSSRTWKTHTSSMSNDVSAVRVI